MEGKSTQTKNIFFYDNELFLKGKKYFNLKEFDKALDCFAQFSRKSDSCKKIIAGRIAITLMKLGDFEQAKELLKQSIEDVPEKERDYISLMAECLYGLGRYKDAEDLCVQIFRKYPYTNNLDIDELEKKVSIHPHLNVLRSISRTDKEYNTALENIINILINDKNKNEDEACYYAKSLIESFTSESTTPYVFLLNHFKEKYSSAQLSHLLYLETIFLLEKLEKSFVRVNEKSILRSEILSVYEKSPCYKFSKYYETDVEMGVWSPLAKITELAESARSFANLTKAKYLPVLNLENYFASELQLIQS